jgi:hypothetical protein
VIIIDILQHALPLLWTVALGCFVAFACFFASDARYGM